jgi:hypothetical protein
MNLLITNSYELQAYVIACNLREHAARIVITEGGDSVNFNAAGFKGMLPCSRLVDARHRVPHFAGDWLAGRLSAPDVNTDAEEAYIRRIEDICALEHVDTIFPSLDPEIYLLAKNKQRFAAKGVLVVVPEFDIVRIPLNKAHTIQTAQRVGFPCPTTFFPASERDIERIAEESQPPWIVKPRFSAHGHGMSYVAHRSELRSAVMPTAEGQEWPIVQEYVPGGSVRLYYITVGRDSELLSLLTPQNVRTFRGGYRVYSRTDISATTGPYVNELRNLVRALRLWGGYTVQTKVDARDGSPRLMEINARFGHNLWRRTALGVNEPLILLQLAQGKPVTANLTFPDGVIILDPIKDFWYLCRQIVETLPGFGRILQGQETRRLRDPVDVNPRGLLATLRAYRREYFSGRRRIVKPDVANLFVDPWPCIRSFLHEGSREVGLGLGRVRDVIRRRKGGLRVSKSR